MPISIDDRGADNNIAITDQQIERGSGKITILGDGNNVAIQPSEFSLGMDIQVVNGASLTIGANLNARSIFIHACRGAVMTIGRGVGFNGLVRLMMHEAGNMTIGDGCLFGDGTDVTNSDMHSIIDVATGQRMNPARDVLIGERVWIGQRCMVLKGGQIGRGSVVGAGSVVSAAVPEFSLAAGSPARVVKAGVSWDFRLL